MITLAVNELLKDKSNGQCFRILWIDEGNLLTFLIEVTEKKALPFSLTIKEVSQNMMDGLFIKIDSLEESFYVESSNIPEKQLMQRDKAWSLIKDLVVNEPDIYQKDKRGKLITDFVSRGTGTKLTIYKYLRRYWQRGKTINSLLPDYYKSGGKGKERMSSEKKRGRPRITNSVGINVTDETKTIFRKAIKKYYQSSKKNTLVYTYKMMIKEFYSEDTRYENGVKHIIIKDENSIPTLRQLRYWFKKEFDLENNIIKREGRKKFERDYRAILGNSTFESLGPGSRYQIDATIGDVYLVSRYNSNWIIGRPVIYLVVDVFSHLITGLYIGLEGPSWAGMMMAIENSTADKQSYCKQYGINISNELWPSSHLPEVIIGDRGELEGYNVNHLIEGLNIQIENNPSFRPDWKGIVEKLFDTSQKAVRPFLPGYVQKDSGERGVKDYRLDAKLNIEEYTKIIINFVLHYNKNFYMNDYLRDNEMIEDNVKPTPLSLWNWGIKNKAGKLRKVPDYLVKFYLLPRDKATVTAKGIKFKSLLYSCEQAIKENWFIKARNNGSWKVEVSYDPRNMNNIYLHSHGDKMFHACSLLNHQERYIDKGIEEINQLLSNENLNFKEAEHALLQQDINFFSNIQEITRNATRRTQEQFKKTTKRERIKDIKVKRENEKEAQRKTEAFQLGLKDNVVDMEITELNDNYSETTLDYRRRSVKELFDKRRGKKD